jgi:UDP-glucose 4-epimerase
VRILLTGATGFVGRHLLPRLADAHEVIPLSRRPVEGSEAIIVDLSQPLDRAALPGQVDVVIHLAQSEHYRDFPARADDIFALNVRATFELLDYARAVGAATFLYASSGGVYGPSFEPLTEDRTPAVDVGFYLTSKQAGELMVQSYAGILRTAILRFFFVYGPGQNRMLVHTLAERLVEGKPITVEGDPGIALNPVFVDDAVKALERALSFSEGGIFNVAGPDIVTLTDLVELIGREAGRQPDISHSAAEPQGGLVAEISRMVEVLGAEPQTSLPLGIRRVLAALPQTEEGSLSARRT